jgi:lysozyme
MGMKIKGIDVSHHNDVKDWAKVKADDVKFAMIKATQGVGYKYVDYFRKQAPLALGNGIDIGAYHYATFSTVPEALAQARYFESVIKDYKLTYPVVCDLEENEAKVSRKQLTDALITFLEYLENKGYFAMWYTGDNFLDTQLEEERLKPYAGWVARYGSEPKNHADIWQYTSTGRVNGIIGDVDLNWSYRDFAAEIRAKNAPKVPKGIGVLRMTGDCVVRTGPNAAYAVVQFQGKGLILKKGGSYKTHGYQNGWYNVGAGWVHEDYVEFRGV